MGIDPKTAMWLNVIYGVLTGLTVGALQAAGIRHPDVVVAWAGILALPLNLILHAVSSSTPGPAAQQDPAVVKAASELAALPSTASLTAIDTAKQAVVSSANRY